MKETNIDAVYKILKKEAKHWKVPVVELMQIQTKDPFKVLITTILSARTKDEVTAQASRRLFAQVQTIQDFKKYSVKQVEKLIFPVGFYKTKALHLKKLPQVLEENFGGKIPRTIDELCNLPGVGRKTANLVVAVAFKEPALAVDTHVHRIMNILPYVKTKTPFETEMELRKKLPKKYWMGFNAVFVAFGQHLCRPVSPHCDVCPVYNYCERVGVTPRKVPKG